MSDQDRQDAAAEIDHISPAAIAAPAEVAVSAEAAPAEVAVSAEAAPAGDAISAVAAPAVSVAVDEAVPAVLVAADEAYIIADTDSTGMAADAGAEPELEPDASPAVPALELDAPSEDAERDALPATDADADGLEATNAAALDGAPETLPGHFALGGWLDTAPAASDAEAPLLDDELEHGIASVFAALHAATQAREADPGDDAPDGASDDADAADNMTFRLLGELDRLWHRAA